MIPLLEYLLSLHFSLILLSLLLILSYLSLGLLLVKHHFLLRCHWPLVLEHLVFMSTLEQLFLEGEQLIELFLFLLHYTLFFLGIAR